MDYSLNLHGSLREFSRPAVMGIINVTPDSFYSGSRAEDDAAIRAKAEKMIAEGADFIDIGAYSTRPGCYRVTPDEELRRLELAFEAVRRVSTDIPLSVDTFRASVARKAVSELSADIVNDVTGGSDKDMFSTVAELHAPYVLMHMRGTIDTMHEYAEYDDVVPQVLRELADKVSELELMGVADIIVDPGFGFSKNLEQNYLLLRDLQVFNVFKRPLLVGVSRKSMITHFLGVGADDALSATTAINMIALQRGADILRVHDVEAAVQAVKIFTATKLSPSAYA